MKLGLSQDLWLSICNNRAVFYFLISCLAVSFLWSYLKLMRQETQRGWPPPPAPQLCPFFCFWFILFEFTHNSFLVFQQALTCVVAWYSCEHNSHIRPYYCEFKGKTPKHKHSLSFPISVSYCSERLLTHATCAGIMLLLSLLFCRKLRTYLNQSVSDYEFMWSLPVFTSLSDCLGTLIQSTSSEASGL